MKCSIAVAAIILSGASAFTVPQQSTSTTPISPSCSTTALFGRAAAVRAATKGKTDAKKAKTNAFYGKKIIMAVKQGGSPDPVANGQLAALIKAAKANSVPVDVSFLTYYFDNIYYYDIV